MARYKQIDAPQEVPLGAPARGFSPWTWNDSFSPAPERVNDSETPECINLVSRVRVCF